MTSWSKQFIFVYDDLVVEAVGTGTPGHFTYVIAGVLLRPIENEQVINL